MIEQHHMDVRHFVIEECNHLANSCTNKCFTLFRYLSCLGAIICDVNTIGIVSLYACRVCDALVEVVQLFTRRP